MDGLNREFAKQAIERLDALPPDRKPAWGKLTADELVPHLIGALRHSMGQLPALKFQGNWFTTTILPPVVFALQMTPPKNLKVKSDETGEVVPALQSPGDLATLGKVMEEFIAAKEQGTLTTAVHPLFGDLGPDGWAKINLLHIRHHLKQFQL